MDKLIGKLAKETAKAGEKTAPLKSVKIKLKFQKVEKKKLDRSKESGTHAKKRLGIK